MMTCNVLKIEKLTVCFKIFQLLQYREILKQNDKKSIY